MRNLAHPKKPELPRAEILEFRQLAVLEGRPPCEDVLGDFYNVLLQHFSARPRRANLENCGDPAWWHGRLLINLYRQHWFYREWVLSHVLGLSVWNSFVINFLIYTGSML